MRYLTIIIIFFLFGTFSSKSQDLFRISGDKKSFSMPFEFVNNMIVIPVKVNGKELSFILDTGVDKSILINLKASDSLQLNDLERIKIQGLGEGNTLSAFRSKNNELRIGKILNFNHQVYVIMDDQFDLSAKMGMNINGIIGGDLFKNFIVETNYSKMKLVFYNPDKYKYKNCKGCETFNLEFYKNKPYINAEILNDDGEVVEVKLLIDSGGGDALWLFENSKRNITLPVKYFEDFLGKGLSGSVFGKRGRISEFNIGQFSLKNATVAFPDSTSMKGAYRFKERNGTLGAEILKRFDIIFDYQQKLITLKKNKKSFKDPFLYNKSGIELIHGGDMLVKKQKSVTIANNYSEDNSSIFTKVLYSYSFEYEPSYKISLIRKDSPALYAGLREGDIILKINGKNAYEKKMDEIIYIFSSKNGKKINLEVERGGEILKFQFQLKNML